MSVAHVLSLAPLPVLAYAAANDVAVRRVPDWASVFVAVCGLAARATTGGLLATLSLMGAVFVLLFFCWKRRWLGGGDVKLLTACAALVPAGTVPDMFLTIALCGGMLALVYLLARQPKPVRTSVAGYTPGLHSAGTLLPVRVIRAEWRRMRRGAPLPYACAIAAGCAIQVMGS